MIQMLLSIIISLAMLSGGVSTPAELGVEARSWTLGNVELNVLGLAYELEPMLNLSGEVSEDEAALQFSASSGGTTLLPVSLGIDGDAVKLSFGTGERVYTIDNDTLIEMSELDAYDLEEMEVFTELYQGYIAFLGAVKTDPAAAETLGEIAIDALLESAATEPEEVTVEVGDQTMAASQVTIDLSAASAIQILDALAGSGVTEFEAFIDTLLDLVNESVGTNYASFSDLLADADPDGEAYDSLGIPFALTVGETDDIGYVGIHLPIASDDVEMNFAEEVITRGEETDINYAMSAESPSDGINLYVTANSVMQGPVSAPTSTQADMTLNGTMEGGGAAIGLNVNISYLDETDADGLNSGSFDLNGSLDSGTDTVPFDLSAQWTESADANDSATTSVQLGLNAMDIDLLGLSFDLNRMSVAGFDAFGSMEEVPLTMDILEADSDDPEVANIMAAIMADASRTYMDVMQLYSNSGLQQLVDDFTAIFSHAGLTETSADDATIGIIGGSDGPRAIFVN